MTDVGWPRTDVNPGGPSRLSGEVEFWELNECGRFEDNGVHRREGPRCRPYAEARQRVGWCVGRAGEGQNLRRL